MTFFKIRTYLRLTLQRMICLAWILPMHPYVFGQITTLSCRAYILDQQDSTPIEWVQVYLEETAFFTQTDSNGYFELHLPNKEAYTIQLGRVGYLPKSLVYRPASPAKNQPMVFYMQKRWNPVIEIQGLRDQIPSILQQDMDALERLPSASGNLESVLPSLALGLRSSAGGELSYQYSVRGGSYDENLVFVNGFEIFRPQLIRHAQQEGLSFPNPDLIQDLRFYSGGFEPRYGDKLASVLDIRYKVPQKTRASISGSLLGGSAHVEGSGFPFANGASGKKFHYMAGARYKTSKYLLGTLDVKGEYQPDFTDIQTFVSYAPDTAWQCTWIANLSRNQFRLIPESASTATGSFFQLLRLNTEFEGSEWDVFEQNMSGLSLRYQNVHSQMPWYLQGQLAVYDADEAERYDLLGYYRLSEIEVGNRDEEEKEVRLWGTGTQHLFARNRLKSTVWNYECTGGMRLHDPADTWTHQLHWGMQYRVENLQDRINEWERLDSAAYSIPLTEPALQLFRSYKSNNAFTNHKLAGWVQDEIRWQPSGKQAFRLLAGLRVHRSSLNGERLWNPRMRMEWLALNHPHHWNAWLAVGAYHQPPFYREMRRVDGRLNEDLRGQKSTHFVLGWQRTFRMSKLSPSTFRWISEVYYKRLWDLVSYELENVSIRYSGQNDAQGYAVGWDHRVHGEFVPGVESWVNLSFLRTHEQLLGIQHRFRDQEHPDGLPIEDVPRPTDQFVALSIFFQDYLPKHPSFRMHIQINIASGLPYGLKGDNLVYRNDHRLKAYHRADIGFSWMLWDQDHGRYPMGKFFRFCRQAWISAEVYNLLKVKNEASVSWIRTLYNYQFAIPNYLTGQRFNLKFRLEF